MSKVHHALSRRKPRKPIRRISPSTLAAEKRVAAIKAEEAKAVAPVPAKAPAKAVAPAPAVAPTPTPEPAPEVVAPGLAEALAILSGSNAEVEAALSAGSHDAHLDALLAAEIEGKNRKGALFNIKERMK